MTVELKQVLVCRRCGVKVHLWNFGWKHCNGWRSGLKSCGERPDPVSIHEYLMSPAGMRNSVVMNQRHPGL